MTQEETLKIIELTTTIEKQKELIATLQVDIVILLIAFGLMLYYSFKQ